MMSLRFFLMLFFLGLPLLEIAVLIQVGQAIGLWPTLGLLFLAAAVGMIVIRQQGVSMLGRMFGAVSEGRFALGSIVDSYVKIVAGCLLIVPGFLTDALGIALLVPPLRRLMLGTVMPGMGGRHRVDDPPGSPRVRPESARPIVIEGTYERLDDDRDTKA